ncbi:hypothetical protein AncyloWKF20_05060 [Ancylobacter sp. WKF20]|uniref:glycine-rich domain-containing protein n=1 Tax=Ancylobacter sp. WKF20 TaxID=3039801 RepID=UPI00243431D6|nr:hypothetical protein [Ancylobacter sp. WKF20]WGD31193.1 hypothetical protein AncyloWKF20_05060 [Ancylobacter sp. WKF20]
MKYYAPFGSSDPNAPYVDRNTPGAVVGSKVPAKAIETLQRELAKLTTASGLAESDSDTTQVATAVRSQRLNYAVAGGSANALTVTLDPAPADMAALTGVPLRVLVSASNTGAVTLTVNGFAGAIRHPGGEPLAAKAYVPGIIEVMGTGTDFILLAGGIKRGERILIFDTVGTTNWTVPIGVQWLDWVEVYGAGGGAGTQDAGFSTAHGEGGGGGGYAGGSVSVSPGDVIAITVGAAGVTSGTGSGTGGGTSSFGSVMSATGGGGGTSAGASGTGGIGTGGQINLRGGSGYDGSGNLPRVNGFGGDAAGPHGGKGGNRVSVQATWPGGGGGLWYSDVGPNAADAERGGVIVRY